MRRGTDAAVLFGGLLYEIRVSKGLSLHQVASKMGEGIYASTISQAEKAQRAVKEPRLEDWARGLEVDVSFLRERWLYFQIQHPDKPINRNRGKSTTSKQRLVLKIQQLTIPERERAMGYIDRLIEEREE